MQRGTGPRRQAWSFRSRRTIVCLGALAVAIAVLGAAQSTVNPQLPAPPHKPLLSPDANRLPDANDQMEMREQQGKKQNYTAANLERRKQIADDSAKLLKLAADLNTEVDKTTKDTLSLSVIRRADEIEKLAHNVKEKMKLTVGAS
jgi:hypothetical protein